MVFRQTRNEKQTGVNPRRGKCRLGTSDKFLAEQIENGHSAQIGASRASHKE
jgi:hypothetical protein